MTKGLGRGQYSQIKSLDVVNNSKNSSITKWFWKKRQNFKKKFEHFITEKIFTVDGGLKKQNHSSKSIILCDFT